MTRRLLLSALVVVAAIVVLVLVTLRADSLRGFHPPAAGFLLRPYLPGIRLVPRRRALSRLERAVEAVERARGGETAEERKALELLAAELRKSGSGGLAWTATELAWSPLQPPAEKTGALTESVRRELAGRTNGHRA